MVSKKFSRKYITLDGKPIMFHTDGDELDKIIIGETEFKYPFQLNLGCGYRKEPYFINVDNRVEVQPDLVWDILEGFPFPDDSFDTVRAYDFLEHILPDKVIPFMEEVYRILKPNGLLDTFTPSTDGRGAFMDPTHRSFWNICSWMYYTLPDYKALYGIKANFVIEQAQDVFTDQFRGIIHTICKLRKA